jgi:predicted DCC family thiol-disulfide oxidoreductase YuxK
LQTKNNSENEFIVFYDSYCVLCNRFIKFILLFDKKAQIKFAPINGKTYLELFSRNQSIQNVDTVILKTSNHLFIKSKAFYEILNIIGGPIKILKILSLLPQNLNDYFYDLIAKNRFKVFGKYDSCPLIPNKIKFRFLP